MGTLEEIGRHLVLVLQPLKNAVESPDSFRQFIYRLGWNATSIPPSYIALATKVDDCIVELEDLIASPDIDKAIRVITKVKVVVEAIDALSDVPAGVIDGGAFLNEIKDRLFEILFTDYLSSGVPALYTFFKVLGVIEPVHFPSANGRPSFMQIKMNWDKIPQALAHPDQLPQMVYGWGGPGLKFDKLAHHFLEIFQSLGLPVSYRAVDPKISSGYLGVDSTEPFNPRIKNVLNVPFAYFNIGGSSKQIGLSILELPKIGANLPGILLQPNIPSELGATFRVRDDVNLRVKAGSNIAQQFGILIRPNKIEVKYPFQNGAQLPDFGFGIGVDYAPANPKLLIGSDGSTRLQVQGVSFDFEFRFKSGDPEVIVGFEIKGLALILQASETDGFMRTILGSGQTKIDIPLGIEWSTTGGIKFKGGGGFEVAVSPHLSLGPITIDQLLIRLAAQLSPPPPGLKLEIGANIKGDLGPLQFVVQNIGLRLEAQFRKGGNAGPFDIKVGFKPPNGIGLSVDSGVLKGGGFLYLDFEKGEYMGALELEFQGLFSLKAIGIINTKMPDGSDGFSLLIIITAEFTPIQLGFGFTLNGVGGLLGLNRTTKIDVLKEGIKTNAIKSILFPEDIVANINRIVSDIKQVFPVQQDRFIIGPMAKLGWGTPSIITLELGILIEIPVPRIAILGVIKAMLPEESTALLKIQVNFLGIIDFENKYISFDASLYDSRLLIYTLTGDMAFRLSWGDHPVFILSIGGFHPAFKEAPGDLQNMTRITISLLSGDNPRISIQNYFAVTSNTVQFGAKAELYAAAAGFNVYGYLGFDVLFQFDPFKFIADIYAGLALRRGTSVLMGINVSGQLSGPNPFDARGEASITILFFDVTVSFHETWGDSGSQIEKEKADLIDMLTKEINDNRNWKAEIPDKNNLHVSIKEIKAVPDKLVVHPFGILSFSERLVPLEIEINKFGNKVPKDAKKFQVKVTDAALSNVPLQEQFAPANFLEMKDNEKLGRASFEMMKSGFKITGSSALVVPNAVSKNVDYELSYLRKKKFSIILAGIYKYAKSLFVANTKAAAVSQSKISFASNRKSANAPGEVMVKDEKFAIANTSDMKLYQSEMVANNFTEAKQKYDELIKSKPGLKDMVQIVSHYELNPN
jgi:hypothetical protein